jgi:aspartate/methionine/tyrosine aminotransferase
MNLPPFKLERYFARTEFVAPYVLSGSDCETLTIQELLDLEPGAADGLLATRLGYTEPPGRPSLRRTIASLYDNVDADGILVHTGAEEAIFTFMNALLGPRDHIIVHYPSYQSLFDIARSIGCSVTLWHARRENNWELDLDELKNAIRERTRAIVINTPHSPTGYLMERDNYDALIEVARRHGIVVFSDEVYRGLEYQPETRLPQGCDLYENAVSLGVMSKVYGLAGLRIGWIGTRNKKLLKRMWEVKDYTTICNSAPSEYLAEVGLRARQKLLARNHAIVQSNFHKLSKFFAARADLFSWVPPKAGPVTFPTLLEKTGVESFCREVLEGCGVLLVPGTLFYPESHEVRFGFGRHSTPDAIERLDAFLGR